MTKPIVRSKKTQANSLKKNQSSAVVTELHDPENGVFSLNEYRQRKKKELSATQSALRQCCSYRKEALNLMSYLEKNRHKRIQAKKRSEDEVAITERAAMHRFYTEFDKSVTLRACDELSIKPLKEKLADYAQSQKAGDVE